MVDTRRALADVLTLYADNTAGDISAQDARDMIVSIYGTSALFTGATKTASFTAVAGQLYPISIASLAANIDVTFPAAPAAGDTFGFYVAIQNTTDTASSGFALAPFWGVEPLATTDINNVSYTQAAGDGLGKWGLMLDGEILVFRWDAVTSTWVVIQDGRQMQDGSAYLGTLSSNYFTSASTFYDIPFDTIIGSNANIVVTASNYFNCKRLGSYLIGGTIYTDDAALASVEDTMTVTLYPDNVASLIGSSSLASAVQARYKIFSTSGTVSLSAGAANGRIKGRYTTTANVDAGTQCAAYMREQR